MANISATAAIFIRLASIMRDSYFPQFVDATKDGDRQDECTWREEKNHETLYLSQTSAS